MNFASISPVIGHLYPELPITRNILAMKNLLCTFHVLFANYYVWLVVAINNVLSLNKLVK